MHSQVDVHSMELSKYYAHCSLSVRPILFNDTLKITDSRTQLWLLVMDASEGSTRKRLRILWKMDH